VNNAVKKGLHVVVAAGNNGVDACNESPASAKLAMTVGASTSSDGITWFSNYGSCLDLFAPGEGILSLWATSDIATAWLSGTSMASPHVAGIKALYLAKKRYSPAALDKILISTATRNMLNNLPEKSANILAFSNPPSRLDGDLNGDLDDTKDETPSLVLQTQ
jgi:cerevisin